MFAHVERTTQLKNARESRIVSAVRHVCNIVFAIYYICNPFNVQQQEHHPKSKRCKKKGRRVKAVLVCHTKGTARAPRADAVGFNYPLGNSKCLTCSTRKSSDITRRRALLTASSTATCLRARHQRTGGEMQRAENARRPHTTAPQRQWLLNLENFSRIGLI